MTCPRSHSNFSLQKTFVLPPKPVLLTPWSLCLLGSLGSSRMFEGKPNWGAILGCFWHPGHPYQSLDAAMADGGKGKLFLLQHFVKQPLHIRGAPAPLIQSTNSL